MIRFTRGAAYAVASVAFAAAMTFSAPSYAQAADLTVAVPVVQDTVAVAATVATPEAVSGQAVAPASVPAAQPTLTPTPTPVSPLLGAPIAPQKTLDELVVAYAADKTEDSEQDCLAKAVYFEARGESLEGQLAVAEVVMNRAASGRYPATLCKVVTQPAQFSFIRKGRFPSPNVASAAWRKAVGVARIALAKLADTLPSGVLWYHADYVKPSWGRRLNRTARIGVHIFYS